MNEYKFVIASFPDEEYCVCEIYYKGELMAEISQETDNLLLTFYKSVKGDSWLIPLDSFQQALEDAKKYLLAGEEK